MQDRKNTNPISEIKDEELDQVTGGETTGSTPRSQMVECRNPKCRKLILKAPGSNCPYCKQPQK